MPVEMNHARTQAAARHITARQRMTQRLFQKTQNSLKTNVGFHKTLLVDRRFFCLLTGGVGEKRHPRSCGEQSFDRVQVSLEAGVHERGPSLLQAHRFQVCLQLERAGPNPDEGWNTKGEGRRARRKVRRWTKNRAKT